MGFGDRIAKATKYEKQIFDAFKEMGFDMAINGTEHNYPEFVSRLRHSSDQTSLAIRYQPDGVICFGNVPQSCYAEAKAGTTIEKDAYLQYQKLANNGNLVIIIFEGFNSSWNFFDEIKLVPANVTVSRYSTRFPIEDSWITPRKSPRWQAISARKPNASGTPYREVDSSSLIPWSDFKPSMLKILGIKVNG